MAWVSARERASCLILLAFLRQLALFLPLSLAHLASALVRLTQTLAFLPLSLLHLRSAAFSLSRAWHFLSLSPSCPASNFLRQS